MNDSCQGGRSFVARSYRIGIHKNFIIMSCKVSAPGAVIKSSSLFNTYKTKCHSSKNERMTHRTLTQDWHVLCKSVCFNNISESLSFDTTFIFVCVSVSLWRSAPLLKLWILFLLVSLCFWRDLNYLSSWMRYFHKNLYTPSYGNFPENTEDC